MQKATIQLETLTCPSCMQKIENGVKSLDGVDKKSIKVLFNSSKVRVEYDDEKVSIKDIENAIDKLGYEVIKSQVKAL
ncbi:MULTISPECIES: heavy-metal-associated domain-containing protein [Bacillota]|jgi:copper ion binding protein|uniref:Copper chaperone n=4 Tax=root TaxID=1 RepID=A0A927WAA2_9CLOT|nr:MULTISPECIES: heavy-metal-associated domain-containing protein [Bacillota]MBE6061174.1 copper chaperone [Clostridium sulfidigenes]MBG0763427.1 heavy-metal-associated domain-containing protein [Tissierellales bacterium]MBS7333347.1 heavy-metal-associated domain-containing protein [Weeksellaceae bacterium]HCX02985.1 copper chaperone [Clostridiales bacterium]HSH51535.1 heavy-metal-associated domain-containing protein [Bacteroidales bacterium]